ncbi:unnamed protein product [Anisakis simplex]|uniref:Uncharacterized protein n=1 Tax=Anisakis simplex TaxID=6269 RepID=A0A3P6QC04_ANISI|nr:unnamed protein product [Anisakis simplex]
MKQQQPLAGNVAAPPVESWNKTESMKQNTAPAGDLRQVIMPPERKEVDIEEHHQIEEPKPIGMFYCLDLFISSISLNIIA